LAHEADAVGAAERGALAERLEAVTRRIAAAAAKVPDAEPVRLIAVSKGQPARLVRAAYELGQRDFGENYVQELVQKAEELRDLTDLRFHMLGHLQRNKTKHVVEYASALHSVHSLALLGELGRRLVGREISPQRRAFGGDGRLPVLLEVSIAGEAQKSGAAPGGLGELVAAAERTEGVRLVGLMCVPPFSDDPRASRPYFDELVRLRDEHGGPERLPELSMGMTADFEQAIAAGATLVRVGTAIFGARPPRAGQGL
jgi:pyridoxal phosphate enzyme (YggS family)